MFFQIFFVVSQQRHRLTVPIYAAASLALTNKLLFKTAAAPVGLAAAWLACSCKLLFKTAAFLGSKLLLISSCPWLELNDQPDRSLTAASCWSKPISLFYSDRLTAV
jgi:hypothetical protein